MQVDEARQEAIAWIDNEVRKAFIENVDKAFASREIDTENISFLELRAILLITAESFVDKRFTNQTKIMKTLRSIL